MRAFVVLFFYVVSSIEMWGYNSVALVSERTIPTELPPLVCEDSADRVVSHSQRGGSPAAVISVF
jgi:hypothetical protein